MVDDVAETLQSCGDVERAEGETIMSRILALKDDIASNKAIQ
jgi:hypothetical protein